MWRASDLVECLIFIGLALMLAYTIFVTVRFFRRYFLARRESFGSYADSAAASEQRRKNLVADLSRGVGTLKAIALAAPFLGLAGTCYGILLLFFRGYVGSRDGFIAMLSLEISVALVATAAGLVVAIPAAISYNILRACLEKFENRRSSSLLEATPRSYGFAQTIPLRGRFSRLPAFALIGAPVLGILIPFVALFERFDLPRGLHVHIMDIGTSDRDSERIIISVIGTGPATEPVLYLNSKETKWNELGNTLRSQLKTRPHRTVYVEGGKDVPWVTMAYVIDVARGLDAEVVLLTVAPRVDHSPLPEAKTKRARRQRGKSGIKTGGEKIERAVTLVML